MTTILLILFHCCRYSSIIFVTFLLYLIVFAEYFFGKWCHCFVHRLHLKLFSAPRVVSFVNLLEIDSVFYILMYRLVFILSRKYFAFFFFFLTRGSRENFRKIRKPILNYLCMYCSFVDSSCDAFHFAFHLYISYNKSLHVTSFKDFSWLFRISCENTRWNNTHQSISQNDFRDILSNLLLFSNLIIFEKECKIVKILQQSSFSMSAMIYLSLELYRNKTTCDICQTVTAIIRLLNNAMVIELNEWTRNI